MRVALGINTCFAVKRWPTPDTWAPVVRERLGVTLVQHSLDLVEPPLGDGSVVASASRVAGACSRHGLRIQSTLTGGAASSANLLLHPDADARISARRWFHRAIAYTARVGGEATGGHLGAFSAADWSDARLRAARLADLRAALASLAMDARRAGLAYLVFENLPAAREPSTMAMARDLLDEGDALHVPVRLCLDVGHVWVPGAPDGDRDPYAWLRSFARVSPIVQVQQSDAAGDRHWPFTPDRNAAGRIDAEAVLDALGEGGAGDVALIVEVIPPSEQDDEAVLDDLAVSVDYWREAIERRGLGPG
jgi:hypothetical protein